MEDSGARASNQRRGRESADTATDDNEVVEICIGLLHGAPIAPAFPRELVGDLE